MSSGTSTDSLRPWHFFVLSGLAAATAVVVLVPDPSPSHLILLSAAIGGAAVSALALHRAVWPLAVKDLPDTSPTIGLRTRVALEREKMLVLRSIKELEFDRAMGKVSETDFHEMAGRLRARAVSLMKQLDEGGGVHRPVIERELEARLGGSGGAAAGQARQCRGCGTLNDADARFCKACGQSVAEAPPA
jgi:hypothetical protein